MRRLSNIPIHYQVAVAFGLPTVLVLCVGWAVYSAFSNVEETAYHLIDEVLPMVTTTQEIQLNIDQCENEVRRHLESSDAAEKAEIEERIRQIIAGTDSLFYRLRLVVSSHQEYQIEELFSQLQSLRDSRNYLLAESRSNRHGSRMMTAYSQYIYDSRVFDQAIEDFGRWIQSAAHDSALHAHATLENGQRGVQALITVTGIVLSIAGFLVLRIFLKLRRERSALQHEIDHRVKSEKALEIQRRLAETLFMKAPEAMVLVDRDDVILRANAEFTRLFGYTLDEAVGRTVGKLIVPPDERAESIEWTHEASDGQRVSNHAVRLRKDGSPLEVSILADTIDMTDASSVVLAIYRDISIQKQYETALLKAKENAEEAARMKSTFLATMSHEIRTPMNGVIGMTELLLDTPLTSDQKHFVETIRVSGDTLLTIINDILDYSKIEAGHLELETVAFDLHTVVEEIFDVVAPRVRGRDLELLYSIDPDVPPRVAGDVTRLRQILTNLVGNALKFTETGEVVVSITRDTVDPALMQFAVRDTGIGIPRNKQEKLFKLFCQVDSSTTRKYGGTGLGLAISARLVEAMGGRIWVESDEGSGATFFFTVQLVSTHDVPDRQEASHTESSMEGRQILIVDDNKTNLTILSRLCEKWKCTALTFDRPQSAVTFVKDGGTFDLAILDMHMPEVDGVDVGLQIRQHTSAPLLMLSSVGRSEPKLKAHRDLFFACLRKPVKQSVLRETIITSLAGTLTQQNSAASVSPIRQIETSNEWLPMRILLAEDNAINQKLACHMLEKMHYTCDVVLNGLEAVKAALDRPYDIVLMDVQMPEMDGLEATRQILRQCSPTRRPIIIAMTANAMEGDREMCLEAGMDDYISKPIKLKELKPMLNKWSEVKYLQNLDGLVADVPVVDTAALHEMDLDDEVLRDLMVMYIEQAPEQISRIRSLATLGDFGQMRKTAHTLKGTSANLGASRMAEIARHIEHVDEKSGPAEIRHLVTCLEKQFQETQFALQRMISFYDGPMPGTVAVA